MRVEFNQGVPKECIKWLWDNIGSGNVIHSPVESNIRRERQLNDVWYYERVQCKVLTGPSRLDSGTRYVPTIFIEDEKKAMMFVLKWGS